MSMKLLKSLLEDFVKDWNTKTPLLSDDGKDEISERLTDVITNSMSVEKRPVGVSSLYKPLCVLLLDAHGYHDEQRRTGKSFYHLLTGNLWEELAINFLIDYIDNNSRYREVQLVGRQREVDFSGIPGHIDFLLTHGSDKMVVDIKTMSLFYWKSFGELPDDDKGYITQILCYAAALDCQGRAIVSLCKGTGTMRVSFIELSEDYARGDETLPAEAILDRAYQVAERVQELDVMDALTYPPAPQTHKTLNKLKLPLGMAYDSRSWIWFEVDNRGFVTNIHEEDEVKKNLLSFIK